MSFSSPSSYTVPSAEALTLAHGNLLDVFSNRDASSRLANIKQIYHDDVVFYEPDAIVTGHGGINAKVDELLGSRPGWAFVPHGNVTRNHGMLHLAWGFGPTSEDGRVDVKVKGADVIIVDEGKIRCFWVVLEGVTDVKAE